MDTAKLPLPRWEVDLLGDEHDLTHLAQNFTGDGLRIYKDDATGQTLMVLDDLPASASHADVLATATARVVVLSGVLKVARQAQTSLAVGSVVQRQVDGTRHAYLTLHATLVVTGEFDAQGYRRDANGQLVPIPPPVPLLVRLATLAQTDPIVAKVMRLVVMPDAGTWRGLVPIIEVIDHDAMLSGSSVVKKGWASKTQQKRFEHTASSSAAGDASRHGHERFDPPANPMTLDEARSFVKMVMHAWIADRVAQSETACNNSCSP
ncbi:hypothetical protein [Acidovorax kalamii]|uniref:hypothetical protein n=1 Tax=Acidovorax kalamii TaxID=2004485 RepID=UPI001055D3C7|nr:hypothetical protein [Acidovorax kalamii]